MGDNKPGSVIMPGAEEPETSWQFRAEDGAAASQATKPQSSEARDRPGIRWTASEFIAHNKTFGWYALLGVVAIVFAGFIFLLTKDKFSTIVILIVAGTFAFLAARKPRELHYEVNVKGIQIGDKFYPYTFFRSFSIVKEGAAESIWLMPLKRFMPILTIYFEPKDEQKIIDVLAQSLALENHQLDLVDQLMHRLRF